MGVGCIVRVPVRKESSFRLGWLLGCWVCWIGVRMKFSRVNFIPPLLLPNSDQSLVLNMLDREEFEPARSQKQGGGSGVGVGDVVMVLVMVYGNWRAQRWGTTLAFLMRRPRT
ncbi:hypothetical protein M0802_006038 [Mischocyttarus mexicanus]|nr:hypothetical protein M0802_006038 [Mischocyttarus mexicanus]